MMELVLRPEITPLKVMGGAPESVVPPVAVDEVVVGLAVEVVVLVVGEIEDKKTP